MSSPQISILLPVFNAARFLPECLQSLSRQTLSSYEIVAIDDGSSDGSSDILRAAAETEPRLRLIRQDHAGLIAALNHALDLSRGDVVARMDADDVSHPRRLELQLTLLDGPGRPDIVSCLVRHFPRQTLGEGFRIYERWLNGLITHDQILLERFIESPLPHPSILARRDALAEIGGYRDSGWPEDYDLWLRLAAAGKGFAKVPRVLYLWRHHEGRLTRTDSRYSVERFLACKAHHLVSGPLASHSAVIVWGAGQTGRRLSKHLKRLHAPITAFVDIDPRKVGGSLRGYPIHSPDELPALLAAEADPIVLTAVSSRGARALIRERLRALGLVEGEHFWCAA